MKTNKEKLKRIEQLLAKSSGVKEVTNPSITRNKIVKTSEFEVNNYEDVTSYIQALLDSD